MDESAEYVNYCLINNLILLRKEVPSKITDIYRRMTVHLLKNLKSVNVQLENEELHCEIPDNLLKEMNTAYYDAQLYEQSRMLNTLMKMKNNPTSKIIDEI
ncbi:uncharacterized protein [Leptinotarsa decemlineata]|uniref:uncharacterized protein n=1 Tax=Leptinotarsa decemlineata TaxID=7539 RepID=UPI000C25262B|nr:uncharacterized protein LOC111505847 [Leptinotarsa decemlineata]